MTGDVKLNSSGHNTLYYSWLDPLENRYEQHSCCAFLFHHKLVQIYEIYFLFAHYLYFFRLVFHQVADR